MTDTISRSENFGNETAEIRDNFHGKLIIRCIPNDEDILDVVTRTRLTNRTWTRLKTQTRLPMFPSVLQHRNAREYYPESVLDTLTKTLMLLNMQDIIPNKDVAPVPYFLYNVGNQAPNRAQPPGAY